MAAEKKESNYIQEHSYDTHTHKHSPNIRFTIPSVRSITETEGGERDSNNNKQMSYDFC